MIMLLMMIRSVDENVFLFSMVTVVIIFGQNMHKRENDEFNHHAISRRDDYFDLGKMNAMMMEIGQFWENY